MSNQVTLFQQETGVGPSSKFQSLIQAGLGNDLGDGIRSSYAILSIKASKWRIKYKGQETPITRYNQESGQNEPASTLEMVIIKANPFLNKQYYAGKYVEGSNSPPDCYSLDGKVPAASVQNPVASNCVMCPKNQWGSLVGENGVKQKACRDTKKLAVVPLGDIRNAALGGAMLFRVPPSALKDLSTMSDALKARGYPYNSVAVRFGFDIDASHPKPTFKGIRPLTDEEADLVLEMFESDSVAAVLADNDVVVEHGAPAANSAGSFEQEPSAAPVAVVRVPVPQPPVSTAVPQPPPQPPVTTAVPPPPPPVAEAPTRFVPAFVPPPPPGMSGMAVQPAFAGQPPPQPPFSGFGGAPAPAAPAAPPKARKPKATVEVPAPTVVEPTPAASDLEGDISKLLAGLGAFTASAK